MNKEVEKYEGELRFLRERVVDLEKEICYLQDQLEQNSIVPLNCYSDERQQSLF
jgi:cell division protein FtsB